METAGGGRTGKGIPVRCIERAARVGITRVEELAALNEPVKGGAQELVVGMGVTEVDGGSHGRAKDAVVEPVRGT
jgi:hypothetical protein